MYATKQKMENAPNIWLVKTASGEVMCSTPNEMWADLLVEAVNAHVRCMNAYGTYTALRFTKASGGGK